MRPLSSPQADGNPDGPRLRVLVVEDDVATARGMAQLLSMDGCEVEIAFDGTTAVQAALTYQPNLVFLDLGLPGLDGYEVAQRVRRQQTKQRPCLIAVTGHGQEADRLHSYEVGIDLHLTKPVSAGELRHLLERYQSVTKARA